MKKIKVLFVLITAGFCISTGLIGCSGGGAAGANSAQGENSVVAAVRNSAPVSVCANGGISVDVGIDVNGNGVLDPSEVTSTQYVCNGTSGTNGASGLNALVSVTTEAAGANCSAGGKKVSVGLDTNANGILDSAEITSSNYICNGTNGANGLNTLVSIVSESAGSNCANGGSKVTSGLDDNANSILDVGEVTTTTYVCNGATGPAGPGVTWVDVTGTSVQAVSNTGYMADNVSQVTVTLPASPSVGDVVQVFGIGSGGWNIAQNAGQSIVTKDLVGNINTAGIGVVWTARDTVRNWNSVASSADGTKLVAAVYGGQLYTSTDSGVSWTARDSTRNWEFVASSSDGTKLVATVYAGQLYTSVDSGVTWTARDLIRNWAGVASSSDGTKLVASVSGGQLYTSTDSGVTWTPRDTNRSWFLVASSADGTKLVALVSGGKLYTSTDSGVTWTPRDVTRNWQSVTSSADGTKLVASVFGDQLYTSTDSGVTWTPRDATRNWYPVASSSDGTKLVAAESGGLIYTSTDSGVTWTAHDSVRSWNAIASSADGNLLVAMGGQPYTSRPTSSASTAVGVTGSISGDQYDAIELQYIGNNMFGVLSHEGYLMVQ